MANTTNSIAPRCGSCGKCGFCCLRMIRLPDEDDDNTKITKENDNATSSKSKSNDLADARAERAQTIKENVHMEKLARAIIEQKIRPEILREDVIADLSIWLRDMLIGPALPLNKEKKFIEDILASSEMVADAEIYVETLPGCHRGLIERNRADENKKNIYPDPDSSLRVREEVLRNKCSAMVNHFANQKNIVDEGLKKKAVDGFYSFYHDTIIEKLPQSYNSYTGMMACMNPKFLKSSEDIVMFGLGLTTELPQELVVLQKAPPPFHTLVVFILAMSLCFWSLPSMQSIDEHATIETFTTSVLKEGPFFLSPFALGVIRLSFAFICMAVTRAKLQRNIELKIVCLPGSKLRRGRMQIKGWKTQGFYTSWAWNLLGLSFLFGGMIPMLVLYGREDIIHDNPWILRFALVSFEVAAPSAFLTSFIVTYALWPQAFRDHGSSGTVGFRHWTALFQHNGNTAMVLVEVCLMGGLPVMLSHAAFAPLFAGIYQIFVWGMTNVWSAKHGPFFPYFFMDTTLGSKTSIFMVVLLAIMGLFFVLFSLLDKGMLIIEHSEHGAIPNLCCAVLVSYLMMRFKD